MKELENEVFVTQEEATGGLLSRFHLLCAKARFVPEIVSSARLSSALPQLVQMHKAVAITTAQLAAADTSGATVAVPLLPEEPVFVVAAMDEKKKSHSALKALREFLLAHDFTA